jgi:hypothetical protein
MTTTTTTTNFTGVQKFFAKVNTRSNNSYLAENILQELITLTENDKNLKQFCTYYREETDKLLMFLVSILNSEDVPIKKKTDIVHCVSNFAKLFPVRDGVLNMLRMLTEKYVCVLYYYHY